MYACQLYSSPCWFYLLILSHAIFPFILSYYSVISLSFTHCFVSLSHTDAFTQPLRLNLHRPSLSVVSFITGSYSVYAPMSAPRLAPSITFHTAASTRYGWHAIPLLKKISCVVTLLSSKMLFHVLSPPTACLHYLIVAWCYEDKNKLGTIDILSTTNPSLLLSSYNNYLRLVTK